MKTLHHKNTHMVGTVRRRFKREKFENRLFLHEKNQTQNKEKKFFLAQYRHSSFLMR